MRWCQLAIGFTVCSALAFTADTCPQSQPLNPPFVPPPPYPAAGDGAFYVGTPKLWVLVYHGPWRHLPHWREGYRQKIVWWSEGFDAKADPTPAIVISGQRLDGKAPPMVVTGANGSWTNVDFIMSGVNFPTKGCWEITGVFNGAVAKFVVSVE
jgi:hypothetical protein